MSEQRLLIGLIGSTIGASLSPAMHEREAGHHGLRLHYQLIDLDRRPATADDLGGLIDCMRLIGFDGFNVTFPCKQSIIGLLDEVSDEAAAIGAVNTVVMRSGRLVGYNTDCSGWRYGFERDVPDAGIDTVVLLGAGGAGSAIAEALMRMGTRTLHVIDTDAGKARVLIDRLEARYPGRARAGAPGDLAAALSRADGLVHATPTGMVKMPGLPLDVSLLESRHWVSEVVYFPIETELVRAAREKGCRVVDGGGMAVGQAVGAFEHFTGLRANGERMNSHFQDLLSARIRPDLA